MDKLIDLLMKSNYINNILIRLFIGFLFIIFVLVSFGILIGSIMDLKIFNYENIEKISGIYTGFGFIISTLFLIILSKDGKENQEKDEENIKEFNNELKELALTLSRKTVPELLFQFIKKHNGEFKEKTITEIFDSNLPNIPEIKGNKLSGNNYIANLKSESKEYLKDIKGDKGPLIFINEKSMVCLTDDGDKFDKLK